jgi:protein SCO1
LRGTPEQVKAIENSVGVAPAVAGAADSSGNYEVGHAAQVIAFTPDDSAHVVYPFGTRQADWVHDLPLLAQVK